MTHVLLLLQGKLVWNIPLLVALTGLAIGYGYTLKRWTTLKLYHRQPLLFFLGLCLLYLTIGSPLSAFSHLSFSTHMIQMSILYFMIPPIILLGIPSPFPITFQITPLIIRACQLFFRPIVSLYTFAGLFFLYHLPMVLKTLSQAPLVHNGYTLLLFLLSFSMWWPIATSASTQAYCPERKKRYALLSGFILMPACLVLILNSLLAGMNNPFFSQLTSSLCLPAQFSSFDLLPAPFNTRFDQLMGGVLMLGMHKFGLTLTFHLQE